MELLDDELLDFELLEEDDLLLTLEPLREDDLLDRVDRFLTLVPLEDRLRAVDFRTDVALPDDLVRVLPLPE